MYILTFHLSHNFRCTLVLDDSLCGIAVIQNAYVNEVANLVFNQAACLVSYKCFCPESQYDETTFQIAYIQLL